MDQFDDLWERAEISRRELIASGAATGFVAGFALSVQPVAAQTMILTDAAGLDAGMVDIPTSTGPIPAYSAAPAGGRKLPLVLVVQEIFGVHEHIKDVCRRLAKLGYCAVAPSLYHRQGDVTKLASMDDIRPIVAAVPDAQVMGDLDAAAAWATASGVADPAKLAITGFCWGGRIVWLYAAHNPALKAGVAWYGRLVGDTTANQPANPIDPIKAPRWGRWARLPDEGGAGPRHPLHLPGLCGCPARLLCRLSALLSGGRSQGRLAASGRLAEEKRRGLTRRPMCCFAAACLRKSNLFVKK